MAEGSDFEFYATGLRNPFDVYVTPNNFIYCQDNGPNQGFGASVVGYDVENKIPLRSEAGFENVNGGIEVSLLDEINLLIEDSWYGHPNVARYRSNVTGSHEGLYKP